MNQSQEKEANVSRMPLLTSLDQVKVFWPSQNFSRKPDFNKKSLVKQTLLYSSIKDIFPKFSTNKISKVYKVISNSNQKNKLRLNMTTKYFLRKQVIIFMRSNNSERMMAKTNIYVSNINRLLKRVKSEISIDFIQSDNKSYLLLLTK